MRGVVPELLAPFDLVGDEWYREEDLPIAICWGFNPWKRNHLQHYLPGVRLAFVRGSRKYIYLKKFVNKFPPHRELQFYAWGMKLPKYARRFARRHRIAVRYVEDGFLRSFNPGALHTMPWSLTFDSKAPYYETREETDLNALLTQAERNGVDRHRQAAGKAGIELMRAVRLTKYFPLSIGQEAWTPPPTQGRKIILVLGQVEDDAAVIAGYRKGLLFRRKFSNLFAAKRAAKDHPDAYILYRPHPDIFHNGRTSRREKQIAKLCTIIEPTVPLQAVFPHVVHVYAATSLAAFEAAIWGIPVTTLGFPFYAASPAIKNLQGPERGLANLDLHEVFSVAYLEYPRYIHPETNSPSSFFDLASYFLVEKFKHFLLDGLPPNVLDMDLLRANEAYLTPPARLFLFLLSLGRTGTEDTAEFISLIGEAIRYEDVPQSIDLLINSYRIELMLIYVERLMSQFTHDINRLKSSPLRMARVLEAFTESQGPLRGRLDIDLPDLVEWITPSPREEYVIPDALLLSYARALSNNIQYDLLEKLMTRIEAGGLNDGPAASVSCLRGLTAVLVAKPLRSERYVHQRAHLLARIERLYERALLAGSSPNPIFAGALTALALDRYHEVKDACVDILGRLKAEKELKQDTILTEFRKQKSAVLTLARYLESQSMRETADALLEHLDSDDHTIKLHDLRTSLMRRDFGKFHAVYSSISSESEASDLLFRSHVAQQEFESARAVVDLSLHRTNKSTSRIGALYEARNRLDFLIEASAIIDTVPQPKAPKGVVFLATFSDVNTIGMMAPVLREVRRRGYAVISLSNGTFRPSPTGLAFVDKFTGTIQDPNAAPARKSTYLNEWEINWSQKIIKSHDINFYQGFYEYLSNTTRTFDVDINNDYVNRSFFKRLGTADFSLNACVDIFNDVVSQKFPTIILSPSTHVVPHSIFRDFCYAKSSNFLSCVSVNMGYENYFNNLGGRYATTMTVADLTLHPNHRAPFLPRADRFERWYAQERDNPIYQRRASDLIGYNRVHQQDGAAGNALGARLEHERSQGRKIVACLGKIPIDLGVPYDGGPGHEDLRDWLNHTIDSVRGYEDIILLIKPHPHEVQPSIALDLVDRFTDLIKTSIPNNVWILGHRDINNHQLASYLDLAVMWNGSSSLELTAMGIPVLMASHFGRLDYSVEMMYPKDRNNYSDIIQSKSWPKPSSEIRHRAAALIAYAETPDVTIRNDYSWRAVTNDRVGMPAFRRDRVEQLLRDGDPEMERAAARILERFEGGAA